MSRIGKKPVPISETVEVIKITPGSVELKGPQGTLQQSFPKEIKVELDKSKKALIVTRANDERQSRAFHGLTRALLANAVQGVRDGFEKSLEIIGTGYNAKLKGKHLELTVGFFLPIPLMIPDGLQVTLPNPTHINIRGCNKQLVGQFATSLRAVRPPDPYKGKGVRFSGEVVKLKQTKAVGAGKGGK